MTVEIVEIKVSDLSKRFGTKQAVNDLSFEVGAGELFALLGSSGAGKTTTLNLIAGIEKPDKGDVFLNGERITTMKPQDRDFAMVFESYALYPHFTVAENMSFPLKAGRRRTRYSPSEIEELVRATARTLGIEQLLDRFPRELSGGQKQRVGLGRVLVRRPRLYVMDEPIAHLDAKLRHHMRGELKKLQKNLGITTILATPDYNEVVAMADRAAVLSQGVIEQIGTPIELYARPRNETVARAIGDPPINLITCDVARDGSSVQLRREGVSLELPDIPRARVLAGNRERVNLGVRPGNITVEQDPDEGLLRGEVYVFEPLGSEAVATVSVFDTKVKVLCPPTVRLKIGQQVGLGFSLETAHFFCPRTGIAV